jgi:cation diffusion facilitator CzcD-associated flavoprotein CzcO
MTDICIIGAGATGLLLLLLLQEARVDLSRVTIIDPHFDGGDLARKWTGVISNTPWSKTIDSLRVFCPSLVLQPKDQDSTTPLMDIAHLLRGLTKPLLKQVRQIQGRALQSDYNSDTQIWTTRVSHGEPVNSAKLILAQGSDPKSMDLPIPSIPFEIALDESRLKYYVKQGEKVVVFGTMHSGTLVINNLTLIGAEVTACYKAEKPFYWARDGAYDGIKADAADIADRIIAGDIKATLVPTANTSHLIRASYDADWVVYAMGFSPRDLALSINGLQCSEKEYGDSGRLTNAPAWGFGIAYPNRAPDGVNWDVSVASFLEHMKRQIPSILQ